jgi:hypothetical protein
MSTQGVPHLLDRACPYFSWQTRLTTVPQLCLYDGIIMILGSFTIRMRTVLSLTWQTWQRFPHLSDEQCPEEEGWEGMSAG